MRPPLAHACLIGACAALGWGAWACRASPPKGPETHWWKGNTHTHTLWSDGDGAPELVVAGYRERGYDFLVLSDHNVLSRGERWFPVAENSRLTPARVAELRARFGDTAVRTRERDGKQELRLATLDELRARFEAPGAFALIEGEEVTDKVGDKPVHLNALNVADVLPPQGGTSVSEALERNFAALAEHGRANSRPVLGHVNHPNFGWAVSWQDIAGLASERFFEVYNGHPLVHNHGDATRPGTEEMWDLANAARLRQLALPPLFGLATDDAHAYHETGVKLSNPYRGWIHVRAERLDAESLLASMRAGDFYASSGVELEDVRPGPERYVVDIAAQPGVTYSTRFVGVLREGGDRGFVLHESAADPAVYEFSGRELFVRAVVISSRPHPNPYAEGDFEQAWCQPWAPAER